jgi:hypothetical protein
MLEIRETVTPAGDVCEVDANTIFLNLRGRINKNFVKNILGHRIVTRGSRVFVVIQQRLRGHVSFHRNWTEYERGFGDESDFWIGESQV